MDKRESIKYDLIAAIGTIDHWEKFMDWQHGPPFEWTFNELSDTTLIHDYEMLDLAVLEEPKLSLIEIMNLGSKNYIEIQEKGWYEVVYDDENILVEVNKYFEKLDHVKEYLLTRVDEFADYVIKKDLNLKEILPFEYKLYKIKDYYNLTEQVCENLVQLLKAFEEAEIFDNIEELCKPLNTVYEMIKEEELKSKND